jgi:hypothetical protein
MTLIRISVTWGITPTQTDEYKLYSSVLMNILASMNEPTFPVVLCVSVHRGECSYMCMSICICTVFLKKYNRLNGCLLIHCVYWLIYI